MNMRSSWLKEAGQTREDTRLTQIGATTPANTVDVLSGVLPGSYEGIHRLSGLWLSRKDAMTGTLHGGRAVIQGPGAQGVYPVALNSPIDLPFAAGDAQFGRIDLVVIRIYDGLYDASNRYDAVAEIIQGVPGQAPAPPAAPAASLPLFEVLVPAGASAGNDGVAWATGVKDRRTTVVAVGGIRPATGEERQGAYPGQYQDSADGTLQRWNDKKEWVSYPRAIGGIAPAGAITIGSYVGQYRDTPGGVLQRWNGTVWQPAAPYPAYVENRDGGTTTSLTYTPTLAGRPPAPLTITFTAPPSGKVLLAYGNSAMIERNGTGQQFTSVRVTQGATLVQDATDEFAAKAAGGYHTSVSTQLLLGNLQPGTAYTVTAVHRVKDATQPGWFDHVFIRVDAMA